jgi:hypothetical protein
MIQEFGIKYVKPVRVQDLLAQWSGNPTNHTKPINLKTYLPQLFVACFMSGIFKTHQKRVLVWTKLLLTIALIT